MSAEHKQRDFHYLVKVLKSCKIYDQVTVAENMYENYKKMYLTNEYDDLWFSELVVVLEQLEW